MHAQSVDQFADEIKTPTKKSTPRPDPWYKRYPTDYLRGTRRLSLAARGAYSDILDLIFIEGGPIPDDNRWVASALHITARQWLKVRQELFAAGKLILRDGGISNQRAETELTARQESKVLKLVPPRLGTMARPKSGQTSPEKRPKVGPPNGTFLNEINGGKHTEAEAEAEADKTPTTLRELQASKSEAPLAGLNGSAEPIIRDVTAWMHGGDEPSARQWLATMLRQYGQDVIRDGYAKLKTDIASGQRIARPLQTMATICQRLAKEATDAGTNGKSGAKTQSTAHYDPSVAEQYRQAQAELMKRPMVAAPKRQVSA